MKDEKERSLNVRTRCGVCAIIDLILREAKRGGQSLDVFFILPSH